MSKYVVIDLEMCRVPRKWRTASYHAALEIIQVGAVLLDENLQIISSFSRYVKPQIGFIDGYIRNLTGITPEDVKDAPDLKTVLTELVQWMPEDAVIVSWSDTDRQQIRVEAEQKDIEINGLAGFFESWIDCQKIFDERLEMSRASSLEKALLIADIPYREGAHNGLIDAWNTALLYAKMLREPQMKLNEYYLHALGGKEEHLTSSLGGLLQGLDLCTA